MTDKGYVTAREAAKLIGVDAKTVKTWVANGRLKGKIENVVVEKTNVCVHKDSLNDSWQQADEICLYQPEGMDWNLSDVVSQSKAPATIFSSTDKIIEHLLSEATSGDHILIMSNGGFEAIHQRMLDALQRNEK